MKILNGNEEKEARYFIEKATEIALKSTCLDAKCGSIIVKDKEIIGQGYNSPPKNLESQRRCQISKDHYHKRVTDKTCCVHAEQRAIIDAFIRNPNKLKNSKLYFIRVDKKGNKIKAGKPYCTICSKMVLDSGISEFIRLCENGIIVYDTEEYNEISFNYKD